MSSIDDQLTRLLRAAAQVRQDPVCESPYGLETRVLAAWRGARTADGGFWDMTLLVRGLIVAGLIMLVSVWPAWNSTTAVSNPFADFLQLTDSTIPSDDAP